MNMRYILRHEPQKGFIKNQIDQLPADGSMEISIRPHKTTRSLEQNNLYHMWVGILASETGYRHDQMHDALRASLLEPVSYPDLTTGETRTRLRSTTELSVGEFSAYLDAIDQWANDFLGCYLPKPSDQYAEAMGYRREKHAST